MQIFSIICEKNFENKLKNFVWKKEENFLWKKNKRKFSWKVKNLELKIGEKFARNSKKVKRNFKSIKKCWNLKEKHSKKVAKKGFEKKIFIPVGVGVGFGAGSGKSLCVFMFNIDCVFYFCVYGSCCSLTML